MTDKIIKTDSKAYGYNYASLTDIVRQGYELPKMKTGTEDGKEYVYYYDVDLKEWIRGAQVVIPQLKGGNASQQYGAALTYARRYTTLMAYSLTSGDDEEIENKIFDEPIPNANLKSLADEFRELYSVEDQARILNGLHIKRAEDIGTVDLQKYVNYKKYGEKQTDKN